MYIILRAQSYNIIYNSQNKSVFIFQLTNLFSDYKKINYLCKAIARA